jgi:gamma-glutamylcyclotransferase (GGCT)/AIG2-like uncharacterized protein YtfP
MRGYGNNRLLRDSKYIGSCETVQLYGLYVNGVPVVIENDGIVSIRGELYEVCGKTLYNCDVLEGHPFAYERKLIQVKTDGGNKIYKAWLYFYPRKGGILVGSGNYRDFVNYNYY